MRIRFLAAICAFIGVPLLLGLVGNLAYFSGDHGTHYLRAKANIDALLVVGPAQAILALALFLPARSPALTNFWFAIASGALAGAFGAAVAHIYFPVVAHPTRLYGLQIWSGAFLGMVAFAVVSYLRRPPPPPVPDSLDVLRLATPSEYHHLRPTAQPSYTVGASFFYWTGLTGAVFFFAVPLFDGEAISLNFTTVALAAFGVLCLYLVAVTGKITLTGKSVTHSNLFGPYRILWNEVLAIEVSKDQYQTAMVLFGDDKHLSIFSPQHWSGSEAHQARELLAEVLKSRALIPTATSSASFRLNRNVRLRDES